MVVPGQAAFCASCSTIEPGELWHPISDIAAANCASETLSFPRMVLYAYGSADCRAPGDLSGVGQKPQLSRGDTFEIVKGRHSGISSRRAVSIASAAVDDGAWAVSSFSNSGDSSK
jgi:hypothetical protein